MAYTPVEIRHVKPSRGVLGYERKAVDRLLSDIADSFEAVWRERADFGDRIEQLESDIERHRELEGLLRTTLVSAERAAHELKDHAKREAETITEEAHAEAREITRAARAERERLVLESRRIRLLLNHALDAFDDEAFGEPDEPVDDAEEGAEAA